MRLRSRLRKALDEIAKMEVRHAELEAEAQSVRNLLGEHQMQVEEDAEFGSTQPLVPSDIDVDRKYAALGNKSIIDRMREFFCARPEVSYSPADVMRYLNIPIGHIEGVRAALKRLLFRDRFLRRVGHGSYALNPDYQAPPAKVNR